MDLVVRRPACWHLDCSLPVRKVSCPLRGSQEQEVLSQHPGREVHISSLVRLASDFVSSLRLKITYTLLYQIALCLDRTPYEYSYCWVNIRNEEPSQSTVLAFWPSTSQSRFWNFDYASCRNDIADFGTHHPSFCSS